MSRSGRGAYFACYLLVTAAACGRTAAREDAASPALSTPAAPSSATTELPGCDQVFAPPPGAAPLCDEHVLANVAEIHWRSYGLAEERAAVVARYRGVASRCGFAVVTKPPLFSVADQGRRLEVFEADDASYPRCARGAAPAHRAVVVVSEKIDR